MISRISRPFFHSLPSGNLRAMRTRVKICGVTRPEDALQAAQLGADAIGLVFYEQSPRYVTIEQARRVTAALPPFVSVVGLFVNADSGVVEQVLDTVPLDVLQFHGDESPEQCERYNRPYIKAVRMHEKVDLDQQISRYARACAMLLDSYRVGVPGGTGDVFDWTSVPKGLKKRIILAGGLTVNNVTEAILTINPYAVDVSGGVESSKGIKDADKMSAFIKQVNSIT